MRSQLQCLDSNGSNNWQGRAAWPAACQRCHCIGVGQCCTGADFVCNSKRGGAPRLDQVQVEAPSNLLRPYLLVAAINPRAQTCEAGTRHQQCCALHATVKQTVSPACVLHQCLSITLEACHTSIRESLSHIGSTASSAQKPWRLQTCAAHKAHTAAVEACCLPASVHPGELI